MPTPASRTDHSTLGIGHQAIHNSTHTVSNRSLRAIRSQLPFLNCKHSTRFGFLNLQRSLRLDSRLHDDLSAHLNRLNIPICGLAGAWEWSRGQHPGQHHDILWSGCPPGRGHRSCGVGLTVAHSVRDSLHDWGVHSDRLLWARFKGTINLTIVVAYAPPVSSGGTSDRQHDQQQQPGQQVQHSAAGGGRQQQRQGQRQQARGAGHTTLERQRFFTDLDSLLSKVPGLDFAVVLGDFNSSVGSAATRGEWGGVLGPHGLGARNAAGEELLHACAAQRLCVAGSFFQHRAARKATWRAIGAGVAAQRSSGGTWVDRTQRRAPPPRLHCIDHILVRRQWLSSVRNVRVFRSANERQPGPPRRGSKREHELGVHERLSDHHLLVAELQLKLRPPAAGTRAGRARPCRAALADDEHRRAMAAAATAVAAALPAGTADERWRAMAAGVTATAAAVLPALPQADTRRREWQPDSAATQQITAELAQARGELAAQQARPCTRNGAAAVADLRATVLRHKRRLCRSRRRDAGREVRRIAMRLEGLQRAGNMHAYYAEIKAVTGQRAPRMPHLRGAELLGPAAQASRFAGHFEAVFRDGVAVDAAVLAAAAANVPPSEQDWPLPTLAATAAAVRRLKHWRAADPSGVWAEALQAMCGDAAFLAALHDIVVDAMKHGMPAAVKESVLLPLFKKGDAADANNYRSIQLVSMLRKIVALVLAADLVRFVEDGLLEFQSGFRQQRSCADQIFALRALSEMAVERQQRLYVAYVDLRKAFDSVDRSALWLLLRQRGVPEALVKVLADLHTDATCRVRVAGHHSHSFPLEFGVQQGCPLASVLFNVFFDHVVREALAACPDAGVTLRSRADMGANLRRPAPDDRGLGSTTIPVLMFADDLAALAHDTPALHTFLAALAAACKRWGLVISTEKTVLQLVGGGAATACEGCGGQHSTQRQPVVLCDGCERGWHIGCTQPQLPAVPAGAWYCNGCVASPTAPADAFRPPIDVCGESIAWVDAFTYLGSTIASTGSMAAELARRVQLAAGAFRRLERPVLRQHVISLRARVRLYMVMVTSVLLYGCESWAPSRAQLDQLEVFHRCRLRMMLGVRRARDVSTTDLLARCSVSSIEALIHRRQLRWLGHLARMAPARVAKRVLYSTWTSGVRRTGRQPASLPETYAALVSRYISAAALRAGLQRDHPDLLALISRGITWFTLAQNRSIFHRVVDTMTGLARE